MVWPPRLPDDNAERFPSARERISAVAYIAADKIRHALSTARAAIPVIVVVPLTMESGSLGRYL